MFRLVLGRATGHHLGRGDGSVGAQLAFDDNVAAGREHVGLGLAGAYDTERHGIGRHDGFYGAVVDVGNRHDFKFERERVRVPVDVAGFDAAGDAERLAAEFGLPRGDFGDGQVVLGGGANRTEDQVADRGGDQTDADKKSWTNAHCGLIRSADPRRISADEDHLSSLIPKEFPDQETQQAFQDIEAPVKEIFDKVEQKGAGYESLLRRRARPNEIAKRTLDYRVARKLAKLVAGLYFKGYVLDEYERELDRAPKKKR